MNMRIFESKYDDYREQITTWRERNRDWDSIRMGRAQTKEGLQAFLDRCYEENDWPQISIDEWFEIVDSMYEDEMERLEFLDKKIAGIITDENKDNGLRVPKNKNSMWKQYENKLRSKGFAEATIKSIEISAKRVLNRISLDTTEIGPIKGMVVGNVQSGKTANMAALMAMACDHGWNMFIILSGTIENLRKQTENRIYNDLKSDKCNLSWRPIQTPSRRSLVGERLCDLNFLEGSKDRYFSVVLKNSTRLKNLLEWLSLDENKRLNMKIMIIDDEADQASLNTKKMSKKDEQEIYEERTRINKALVDLVEGNYCFSNKPKAMNYICYTATPYANFLNEFSEKSLYPSNFINFIDPSKEYFGPQEIFGVEGEEDYLGIPIIRNADDFDSEKLKDEEEFLSVSLKDAFYYFLCASATMRFLQKNYDANGIRLVRKQPVSMLIHVSQKQAHHKIMQNVVEDLIKEARKDINKTIFLCKELWEKECDSFSRNELIENLYYYYTSINSINDYPKFDEIEVYLREILTVKHTKILLDEDKDKKYHKGIHLCIDNCKHNFKASDDVYMRLAYPETIFDGEEAPVFIVIGGSTLSRGLTIEGLVTTYFVRNVKQADTLMQMGRWFGYRKGYEMLPRIWLTNDVKEKFSFLSTLDYELRNELRRFRDGRVSPKEYGPYITNTPKVSWLSITAKNKMQNAKAAEMDFSGYSAQTIVFDNNIDIMRHNIDITETLYNELSINLGEPKESHDCSSLVWKNVDYNQYIKNYLLKYKSANTNKAFNEIEVLSNWLDDFTKENNFKNWNVVAAGNGRINSLQNEKAWKICGKYVSNSNRAKIINANDDANDLINIKVLRNPAHLIADITVDEVDKKADAIKMLRENVKYKELRNTLVKDTPLLLIYRVNKEYKYTLPKGRKEHIREDMNAKEDMIGICIVMPGSNKQHVKKITINIPKEKVDEEEFYED